MMQENTSHSTSPARFAIVRREIDPQTSVIAVEGELDLSTAPQLKRMLADSLEAGCTRIVVDLSRTSFLDSTALGVLLGVSTRLETLGRLAIVCTTENILQVFEFSGADGAFAVYPQLVEALAYVSGKIAQAG